MGQYYFWIWLLLISPLAALIVETPHFRDVTTYATPETLVLLDINDTLFTSAQMLGSDAWFEHRLKQYRDAGLDVSAALEKTLSEWTTICHLTQMVIVEPNTDKMLHKLQQNGCPVMGLTLQDFSLASKTRSQLQALHIDLSLSAPFAQDWFAGQGILYHRGILHTSGHRKGETLFKLCDQMGYVPKRIVCIDDKLSHLQDVERQATARGIEFIGLRYGYCDACKTNFRSDIAEVQWRLSSLNGILSDAAAKELVDRKNLKNAPN